MRFAYGVDHSGINLGIGSVLMMTAAREVNQFGRYRSLLFLLFINLMLVILAGCSADIEDNAQSENIVPTDELTAQFDSSHEDALERFKVKLLSMPFSALTSQREDINDLLTIATAFKERPAGEQFDQLKEAWRVSYNQYLGDLLITTLPIREPNEWHRANLTSAHLHQRLNAWPIEAGYIDYLSDYPQSGIVNDLTLDISRETLIDQHGLLDEGSASIGFPVMEFLLWGEDGSRRLDEFIADKKSAATSRWGRTGAEVDYHTTGDEQIGILNQDRRLEYLLVNIVAMDETMQRLSGRWSIDSGYYHEVLASRAPATLLVMLLKHAQTLITEELMVRHLAADSAPYSSTSGDNVVAIVDGIERMFERTGTLEVLSVNDDQSSSWQRAIQNTKLAARKWQLGGRNAAANNELRAALIELLAELNRLASNKQISLAVN